MITKSSGFSLVELLVVIAIIGILSTVGLVSYSTYIDTSNRSAALNTMQTISLAQSEYLTNMGTYYYTNADGGECTPDKVSEGDASSSNIEENLFNGKDMITTSLGFIMCISIDPPDDAKDDNGATVDRDGIGYTIIAMDETAKNKYFLTYDGISGTIE